MWTTFGQALVVAICTMTLVWALSLIKRDASIIDIFWGLGFVVVTWFYFFTTEASTPRKFLVAALVSLWGLRLSVHILFRSIGRGEDYRYRDMRERHSRNFAIWSLFVVFWLQAAILWFVSSPLLAAQHSALPSGLIWFDYIGIVVFTVGFMFESIGDWQLARFKKDPTNKGRVMQSGLWRYTRHPNYFGDALVWWGLFLIALSTPGSLWTIASPILMTFLLLKVSGVSLLERSLAETKPEYRDYARRTPAFFPWRPSSQR
jgi:steroid 5-alpha reductase family enzyme